jgi:hypothetical protein
MPYNPGDLVDVRSGVPTWRPGVVSLVDDEKIVVDLDSPYPTADQWSGVTRRYGGSEPVAVATIWKASEAVSDGTGSACCHIRLRP